MQETPVQFLGWEDLLEKRQATHSSILWASPVAQLVKNPSAIQETWVWSLGWEIPWRRDPVFWPGEFHGLYIVHGVAKSQTRLNGLYFTSFLWEAYYLDGEYIHTWEIESALLTITFLTKAWIPLGPIFLLPPFHGWSSFSNPWVPFLSPLGLEIKDTIWEISSLHLTSHQ